MFTWTSSSVILKRNVTAQPGLLPLLQLLKEHGIKMAVASSSTLEQINVVLDSLKIAEYFDAVVSAHTLAHGKPAPDVFLLAAERLGVDPEGCIVLEDAESGVLAGKAAGAKVIAVPNHFTSSHDHSQADVTVESLDAIDWPLLQRLLP